MSILRTCSWNMKFRSSSATTWCLLYCRFSSVALVTHCDDKATISDEMTCRSTIWHKLSNWLWLVSRISVNPSNLVLSLSNCISMTSTIGAFLFYLIEEEVPPNSWDEWGGIDGGVRLGPGLYESMLGPIEQGVSHWITSISGSSGMYSLLWSLRSTLKWWGWVQIETVVLFSHCGR